MRPGRTKYLIFLIVPRTSFVRILTQTTREYNPVHGIFSVT